MVLGRIGLEVVTPRRVAKTVTWVNYAFAKQQHIRHLPYEEETTN